LKNFKHGNFIQTKNAILDARAFRIAFLRLVDGLVQGKISTCWSWSAYPNNYHI